MSTPKYADAIADMVAWATDEIQHKEESKASTNRASISAARKCRGAYIAHLNDATDATIATALSETGESLRPNTVHKYIMLGSVMTTEIDWEFYKELSVEYGRFMSGLSGRKQSQADDIINEVAQATPTTGTCHATLVLAGLRPLSQAATNAAAVRVAQENAEIDRIAAGLPEADRIFLLSQKKKTRGRR